MLVVDRERIQLKQWAWHALERWGNVVDGEHVPYTFERRIEVADLLVQWLLTEPGSTSNHTVPDTPDP